LEDVSFSGLFFSFLLGIAGFGKYLCPDISNFDMDTIRVNEREAMYYQLQGSKAVCLLCPKACVLSDGQTGACHNRTFKYQTLFTLAFGNLCALNTDPVEKKPLYHFYPGSQAFSVATGGCNMLCLNCQNWTISQVGADKIRTQQVSPRQVVDMAKLQHCQSIAYTYTEPVAFYEFMLETAKLAHGAGLRNLLISNGYINQGPLMELLPWIDAANINLKSFDDEIYQKLNAAHLQPVLDTLKTLKDKCVWLEITNLVVPTWTDKPAMIEKMCNWLVDNGFEDCPLHFSRFYASHKLSYLPPTSMLILEKAYEIAKTAGMRYVFLGNVPGHITDNTFCPHCRALLIERKGYQIAQNTITNGKCPQCGEKIAGRWG
jgi:pyruvate formate lyase activating enzyme